MFDFREFYKEENDKVLKVYEESITEIQKICEETKDGKGDNEKYFKFFNFTGNYILKLCKLEEALNEEYFKSKSFEELLKENHELYGDVAGDNYKTSYANPAYAVEIFGQNLGQLMSYFYLKYAEYIKYAFNHKVFMMYEENQLFVKVYDYIKNCEVNYETLKNMIIADKKKNMKFKSKLFITELVDSSIEYFKDMIKNDDLTDLRYLFKYGQYITDNEIRTAEFLIKYPQEKINKIARTFTEGFKNGFVRNNKDMSKKSNVRVICNVGQEIIIKKVIENIESMNLKSIITGVSTSPNRQFEYDHRFDNALYIDEEYSKMQLEALGNAAEEKRDILSDYAGTAVFRKFGEIPFVPESKKECLKLNEEQSKIFRSNKGDEQQILLKYMPVSEWSFTIIAFPVPEIGDKFEEIFEATCEVNMLDNNKYLRIQQNIIDVLDKGEYVHVKGKGSNETDIKVKMQKIDNPEKETNFVNCGADVNIPVGEVYTSPQLKDTNGILHVEEVYLRDLKYLNLKLKFENGYVTEYSCANFETEEENKKYIQENLLFPNKTLPLGEFAIGTNTLAYVMANKYEILNIMPILIVEKMGPHFAIGDTCFSWSEDTPVYNQLNKKEVIARDNEKSILRKTDIKEAYTQCHTDITLPYDGLEFISVITEDNKTIDIIKNGRFVVEGTEELNKPLEQE